MFSIYEDADYVCVVLENGDYNLFIDAYSLCYLDKTENDFDEVENLHEKQEALLEGNYEFLDDAWDSFDSVHFVLLEKRKQPFQKDEVLGIAKLHSIDIESPKSAVTFSGIHVLSHRRGNGFSHILHRARTCYAETMIECGAALTMIQNDNVSSIRAAASAGFMFFPLSDPQESNARVYFKPIEHDPFPEP